MKGNDTYYDKTAEILSGICYQLRSSPERLLPSASEPVVQGESSTWLLKANVTVFRHADRTPKQKLKFNFPIGESWTQPFVRLLNGEREEIILRESTQLSWIATAVDEAKCLGADGEDLAKLALLNSALFKKINLPGTKAQLKPVFSKKFGNEPRKLTKLTLVFKWGGEVRVSEPGLNDWELTFFLIQFTHAARYQSRDLGENMKKDISIMNKDALNNVKVFTSSERRVATSAEIFTSALLEGVHDSSLSTASTPPSRSGRQSVDGWDRRSNHSAHSSTTNGGHTSVPLIVRKDLLDDSNAAKDLMDDVKKRLKILLRPGEPEKRPDLTWPKSLKKEPVEVVKEVIELLSSFREIMKTNFETVAVDRIQERWLVPCTFSLHPYSLFTHFGRCCGDEPWLFRERWEKLFEDFCNVKQEKFDPSRVSCRTFGIAQPAN